MNTKLYIKEEVEFMKNRCRWKLSILPRKCERCSKSLLFHKYYPIDLEFVLKEPWDLSIIKRCCLCRGCFDDYMNYFVDKYRWYFGEGGQGKEL